MTWKKVKIQLDNGELAEARAPEIISASRCTDIPAFYADWFFNRIEKGYSAWINPFNGKRSYISYQDTRFIVFWSKNPKPLLKYFHILEERNIKCYIQYTLNDYVVEGLEKNVPSIEKRVDTFKQLVNKLGKGQVIWRFDPLILTDQISMDHLLRKIENIGDQLVGYTEKLVFSYADIDLYKKVKYNLIQNNVHYKEWTQEQMVEFAFRLSALNKSKGWNYELTTCGEEAKYKEFNIHPNHCIDDNLMIRIAWRDQILMNLLGVEIRQKDIPFDLFSDSNVVPDDAILLDDGIHYAIKKQNNKDKGQRPLCGCIISKDIGQYNTCPHQCEYCYANTSKKVAFSNFTTHKSNPFADTIIGK